MKRGRIGGKNSWYNPGKGKKIKRRYCRKRRQAGKLEARTGRENTSRGLTGALSEVKRKGGDGWKP